MSQPQLRRFGAEAVVHGGDERPVPPNLQPVQPTGVFSGGDRGGGAGLAHSLQLAHPPWV